MFWWRTRRALSNWLLSHWRSFAALSVGFSAGGISRTSASLLKLSTESMMFLLSGRRFLKYPSGSPPNSRQASPPACSGHSPCVCVAAGCLHTGAILIALSASGVSGSALYTSTLCRPVASQASTAGLLFVLRKLRSPSQT